MPYFRALHAVDLILSKFHSLSPANFPFFLEWLVKQAIARSMYGMYEPAGEDEEGAHNVTITEDMTREDVLKEVLALIDKI